MPLRSLASSLSNLRTGAKLLTEPGLRRFILIPLLINLVLFILMTLALISWFSAQLNEATSLLPSGLSWLASWGLIDWLVGTFWGLFAFVLWIAYGYTFGIVANIIAAPFNGLLAEKIEQRLSGQAPADESLFSMCLRTVVRELQKLGYFIIRGGLVLLLLIILWFIPGLNLLTPVLGWIWGAWCMGLQYLDYPADNNQLSFKQLRQHAWQHKAQSAGLGGWIMLGNMIPVINILVMPIAVAGATVQWLEQGNKTKAPRGHMPS